MAILPLVIAPDPRLKEVSKPVEKVDASIQAILDDMVDTLYAEDAIGLAAVQVGVLKCMLVMDLSSVSTDRPGIMGNPNEKKLLHLINPEIVWSSTEMLAEDEYCLSFPGSGVEVTRPEKVKISYLDYHGNPCILEASGLLSKCVQHEIDHLRGKTLTDYVSFVKREMILSKSAKYKRKRKAA